MAVRERDRISGSYVYARQGGLWVDLDTWLRTPEGMQKFKAVCRSAFPAPRDPCATQPEMKKA